MKARYLKFVRSRAGRVSTVGLFLTMFASGAQIPAAPERCTGESKRQALIASSDCETLMHLAPAKHLDE
jgi:hypothetical protein